MDSYFKRHTSLVITLGLTLFYILLTPHFGIADNLLNSAIGLFVPVGIWVASITIGLAPLILILFCIVLDKYFVRKQIDTKYRILYVLFLLGIITTIVDIVLFDSPVSLLTFVHYLGFGELPDVWDFPPM
jgi:hypothetical protein